MARKLIGAFLIAVFFFSAVRTAFADGPVLLTAHHPQQAIMVR